MPDITVFCDMCSKELGYGSHLEFICRVDKDKKPITTKVEGYDLPLVVPESVFCSERCAKKWLKKLKKIEKLQKEREK